MSNIKRAAHASVKRAVANGRLVRPVHCERCGRCVLNITALANQLVLFRKYQRMAHLRREVQRRLGLSIKAHHDDYAKPLCVRWLCPSCHAIIHVANPGR